MLLSVLLVGLVGGGVVGLGHALAREERHLRARLVVEQMALDLLDRQAAGEARLLLGGPPVAPGTYRHRLGDGAWRMLVPDDLEAELATLSPEVAVELSLLDAPVGGRPVGLVRVGVRVWYADPVLGRRPVVVWTMTDGL